MKAFLVFRILDLILMITYGAALAYYAILHGFEKTVKQAVQNDYEIKNPRRG